jgi:protein-tyrosine phosphatase
MAEGLLRRRLEEVAPDVHVHSAGTLTEGQPATADAVAVVAASGVDLSAHRSRKVTADLVRGADLVIGMSRRHVAEACVAAPEAFPKAFTLKELVRRGEEVGPRKPNQPLDDWLREVHWGRNRQDLLGRSREDDIADPVNQPRAVYEKTAAQLEPLLDRMVDLVWGKQENP